MKKLIFEIDDEGLKEATITFFGVRRDVIQRNTIDLDLNHNTTMFLYALLQAVDIITGILWIALTIVIAPFAILSDLLR